MNLYEYQGKQLLKSYGINIPKGILTNQLAKVEETINSIGLPVVIKAQVHAGGRGKAGGIGVVSNMSEAQKTAMEILNLTIKELKVKKILIEEAVQIKKQYYVGITVDRAKQCNTLMVSSEGGIEIEEVAKNSPEKILTLSLSNLEDLRNALPAFLAKLSLSEHLQEGLKDMIVTLFQLYSDCDLQLVEINPLALVENNQWMACDCKIIIDDNALFRHENLKALKDEAEDNELEFRAHQRGLAYVKLKGSIGIIGNGAGLVMATMDEVKRIGGEPANFLDIGGGAKQEVIQNALEIIYSDKEVKGIFVNVFGGITRCDEVAKGIVQVLKNAPRHIPVVLRLAGTRSEEGRKILEENNLTSAETMEEGAKKVVSAIYSL